MNTQVGKLNTAVLSGLLAIGTVVGGTAMAAAADSGGLSEADRDFVVKAAQGGLMEVAAGKLASKRAVDPAIKAFGERMVTDHTAANGLLTSLAQSKQMTLPDTVSPDEQALLGKLEGLNGAEFDKTYADMMVKDHVDDIKDFQKEVKGGQDPDVKDFAQTTLATLRHHLMLANRLTKQDKKAP
jgi:putative membrane protein